MGDSFEDRVKSAGLFVFILLLFWPIAGLLLSNFLAGFLVGLIVAVFAVGAAELKQKSDGSWTLTKRS